MAQTNSTGSKWLQGALALSGLLLILLFPIASAATKQHCDAYLNSNLPESFKQFKNSDTKALYQCLQVSKSTAQGSSGGYHFLSYLHNFKEGFYLLNFLRQGSQIRLQTHFIGNGKTYCANEKHGNFANFTVWSFKGGIRINQNCDNAYGTLAAKSNRLRDSYSYRQVKLALVQGVWRPIHEEHSKSWSQNTNGSGHNERQVNSWSTATYYRYKEQRKMRDWFTADLLTTDISVGKLLTPSDMRGIADLFPKSRKTLRLAADINGRCVESAKPELNTKNGCQDVSAIESQLNTKGARYYRTLHNN